MEENNKIRISLGTFTVLIVSLLILGMAIVLSINYNNRIINTLQLEMQNEQINNKVSN